MDGCFFRLSSELATLEHVHTLPVPRRRVFLETYRRDLLHSLEVMDSEPFTQASEADPAARGAARELYGALHEAVIRIAEFQDSHRGASR